MSEYNSLNNTVDSEIGNEYDASLFLNTTQADAEFFRRQHALLVEAERRGRGRSALSNSVIAPVVTVVAPVVLGSTVAEPVFCQGSLVASLSSISAVTTMVTSIYSSGVSSLFEVDHNAPRVALAGRYQNINDVYKLPEKLNVTRSNNNWSTSVLSSNVVTVTASNSNRPIMSFGSNIMNDVPDSHQNLHVRVGMHDSANFQSKFENDVLNAFEKQSNFMNKLNADFRQMNARLLVHDRLLSELPRLLKNKVEIEDTSYEDNYIDGGSANSDNVQQVASPHSSAKVQSATSVAVQPGSTVKFSVHWTELLYSREMEKLSNEELDRELAAYFATKKPDEGVDMSLDDIVQEASMQVHSQVIVPAKIELQANTAKRLVASSSVGKRKHRRHKFGETSKVKGNVNQVVKSAKNLLQKAKKFSQISPVQRLELLDVQKNLLAVLNKQDMIDNNKDKGCMSQSSTQGNPKPHKKTKRGHRKNRSQRKKSEPMPDQSHSDMTHHDDSVQIHRNSSVQRGYGRVVRRNVHTQRGNIYRQHRNNHVQRGNTRLQWRNSHMQRGHINIQRGSISGQRGNSYVQRGNSYTPVVQQGNWHGQQGDWHGQQGDWHGQQGNWHSQQGNWYDQCGNWQGQCGNWQGQRGYHVQRGYQVPRGRVYRHQWNRPRGNYRRANCYSYY